MEHFTLFIEYTGHENVPKQSIEAVINASGTLKYAFFHYLADL